MNATTTLQVGQLSVACRMEGLVEAPVVLLAHGVLTDHRIWDGLVKELGRDWRVVRYDLRGHGGTTATRPPYTMDQLAQDAVSLLDALRVSQVHFIGTSLGGMIGQVLGARHADRLISLTLANTTAVQKTPKAWDERVAKARQEGLQALMEVTLERWFTPDCLRRETTLMATVRHAFLNTAVEGFAGCANALRDLDHADLLPRITTPTLLIAGKHDTATPLADSERMNAAIANSKLLVLPAAHQSAAECPHAFASAWRRFQKNLN